MKALNGLLPLPGEATKVPSGRLPSLWAGRAPAAMTTTKIVTKRTEAGWRSRRDPPDCGTRHSRNLHFDDDPGVPLFPRDRPIIIFDGHCVV